MTESKLKKNFQKQLKMLLINKNVIVRLIVYTTIKSNV